MLLYSLEFGDINRFGPAEYLTFSVGDLAMDPQLPLKDKNWNYVTFKESIIYFKRRSGHETVGIPNTCSRPQTLALEMLLTYTQQ